MTMMAHQALFSFLLSLPCVTHAFNIQTLFGQVSSLSEISSKLPLPFVQESETTSPYSFQFETTTTTTKATEMLEQPRPFVARFPFLQLQPHPPKMPPSELDIQEALVGHQVELWGDVAACYDLMGDLLTRLDSNDDAKTDEELELAALIRLDYLSQSLQSIEEELEEDRRQQAPPQMNDNDALLPETPSEATEVAVRLEKLRSELAMLKATLDDETVVVNDDHQASTALMP